MHRHRHLLSLATAALLSAACAEDASTGVDVDTASAASDLAVVVPTGVRERSVVRNVSTDTEARGPARTEHLGYGTYPSGNEYDASLTPYSSIWGQRTTANFLPGQLSVIGSHYYTGNKGAVETNGKVSYAGTQLATQRSMAESSFPFLIDFAREHFIWTEARIYTDRECGLDGSGDSSHEAWWEAVMGGPVFQFHNTTRSSTSDRMYQPSCAPEPPPPTPSTGFTSGGSVEAICYIWIIYDIYTGEIYDQQLLFCTDGG